VAFEDDFADAAAADLLEQLGRVQTRYPLGDRSAPKRVRIITEDVDPAEFAGADRSGVTSMLVGKVLAKQSADTRDVWLIDGEVWSCTGIGKPRGGLKRIEMKRVVTDRRSRHDRNDIL